MNSRLFSRFIKAAFFGSAVLLPAYYMKSKEGQVWSWGFGKNGELGIGPEANCSLPQLIKNIKFTQIDAKKSMSAGITVDGKLYTWGKNRNGVLGHNPPNLNVLIPREVIFDEKITDVSCGYQHLCVLTQKGNVYAWGFEGPKSSFRTIGTSQTIKTSTNSSQPYQIKIKGITQISCSGDYISMVNKEGKVFLIGASKIKGINNSIGKLPTDIIELNLQRMTRVQSGVNFSIGLNDEGKVFAWGGNTFGQLGIGSLKNLSQPQELELKEKVVDISCGDNFAGVVTQNGQVYTWGFGNQGQLGHGEKTDQFLPRKIANLKGEKVKNIKCGGAHTALLMESGKLYMVGRGREGQLGRQQKDQSSTAVSFQLKQVQQLPNNQKIAKVACGANHTLILLEPLK